jgi:tRNA-Thr(GGU) m(6)t(6)A37 methyltransferase TsaA
MAPAIDSIACRPIGVVRSPFIEIPGTPIQTAAALEETARVDVFERYEAGLEGLDGFEYLILVTHLHRCVEERLEVVPYLDDRPHGVFATRAPARPNHLGLSIVRLLSRTGRVLEVAGNDMIDGTPVLDIKPYVPAFDVRHTDRIGWFSEHLDRLAGARADDRMR